MAHLVNMVKEGSAFFAVRSLLCTFNVKRAIATISAMREREKVNGREQQPQTKYKKKNKRNKVRWTEEKHEKENMWIWVINHFFVFHQINDFYSRPSLKLYLLTNIENALSFSVLVYKIGIFSIVVVAHGFFSPFCRFSSSSSNGSLCIII